MAEILTIREQILAKIKPLLGTMTPANGYQLTPKFTERGRFDPLSITQYPAVMFYDGAESADDIPHDFETMDMSLIVEVWVSTHDAQGLSKECNTALGAIRKVMLSNRTFDGLALHTKYKGCDVSQAEAARPLGVVQADFLIRYRTRYGDPYNLT